MSKKPILRGAKTTLRPLELDDAAAIFVHLDDPGLKKMTGTHADFNYSDVETHYSQVAESTDRYDYGIIVGEQLIGEVVLCDIDMSNMSASLRIAIWIADLRNKGYGSEAAKLLICYGFDVLGLNRIELEVFDFNNPARRMYANLGFKLEGTKREALIWGGQRFDSHIMGLLRSEFLNQRRS